MQECMNWQAINFDWNQVRAFLATAEEGSLTAAARALRATQPTVGRQVTALEEALGVTLFERVGRGLQLTQPGRDLLAHVRDMADAAARVSLVASGQSQEISGPVSITASDLMSSYYLPQIVSRILRDHPGIDIRINAANHVQDLLRREADIAIRHVRPEQPDLIARHLCDFRGVFMASDDYIARRGFPSSKADFQKHDLIGYHDRPRLVEELKIFGVEATEEQVKCSSDLGVVVWHMMLEGMGVGILPLEALNGVTGVQRVFPDLSVDFPVWLTVHQELNTSRRIRIVYDVLAKELPKAVPQCPSLRPR